MTHDTRHDCSHDTSLKHLFPDICLQIIFVVTSRLNKILCYILLNWRFLLLCIVQTYKKDIL